MSEYFALAGAWDILAESAKQSNPKEFNEAAHLLDMQPEGVLRGMAYMAHRLSMIPEDEANYEQMGVAISAISEVVSLMAAMLEHQNESHWSQELRRS